MKWEFKTVSTQIQRRKGLVGTGIPYLPEQTEAELKALANLNDDHLAQALSYLKATNLDVGLLLNFGKKSLQVKRVVSVN